MSGAEVSSEWASYKDIFTNQTNSLSKMRKYLFWIMLEKKENDAAQIVMQNLFVSRSDCLNHILQELSNKHSLLDETQCKSLLNRR